MDRETLRAQLCSQLPEKLVDELLEAYEEAKRAYYLGGLRLAEVEGGRFCEAAFRLLQHRTTGQHTRLGRPLNTERIATELLNLPTSRFPDAVRVHIPRSLRLVYDIRNKRDAAHLADGIDPNLQDATVVVAVLDWVLAEFVRLYHRVSPDQASRIVDYLVTKAAPVVQDFAGFLKVLDPSLSAGDHCTVLLYQRGENGATFDELRDWARPNMRPNLRRTLRRLVNDRAIVHFDGERYFITRLGEVHVESKRLLEP